MKQTERNHFPCIKMMEYEDESGYLYQIDENIYKLDMPPINSLFLIRNCDDWYFIDAGKSPLDIQRYVISAAQELQFSFCNVKGILLTHSHWDHTDGLPYLLTLCPNVTVYTNSNSIPALADSSYKLVKNGYLIDDLFHVVSIVGHSDDSIGFIDTRTNTLFSGDAIQLYGISTCGMFIFYGIDNYLSSLQSLLTMPIDRIIASHPYVPNGAFAIGTRQAKQHIQDSIDCAQELIAFTKAKANEGYTDPLMIRDLFIRHKSAQIPNFPTSGFDKAIESILDSLSL